MEAFEGKGGERPDMSGYETLEVDVRGIKVTIRRKGQGYSLLYLHGAFGYEGWPRFLDMLSESFTVFSPIHPGFLEAEGIEKIRGLYDLVLFHLDLIDALELKSPSILGHYFGAMVAAELASVCSHNIGNLVLANPAGFWIDDDPGLDYFIVPDGEIRRHLLADPDSPDNTCIVPDTEDENEQSQRALDKVRALSTVAKFLWPVPDKGLSRRIGRVRSRTLVITGDKDTIVPVAHGNKAASIIPGAKHLTLSGVGHLAMLEKPEEFVTAIEDFLSS